MDGLVCLRGRLLSSTRLLSDEGEFQVASETFYKVGQRYVFLINTREFPWRIWRAVSLKF
jgi:hypothetical protein